MTHPRKDKYKDRYLIKKKSGQHKRRQQECSSVKGRTMNEKDNSRSNNVEEDNNHK